MTTYTVVFTQDELQQVAGLVVAGAKSPNTGAEAIVQAAALLAKFQAVASRATFSAANVRPLQHIVKPSLERATTEAP